MRAKDYLMQAYKTDLQINSKLEQVMRLRSLVEKTTTTLSMAPGSGGDSKGQLENTLVKIVDLEAEMNDEIQHLLEVEAEIRKTISEIEQPELRVVLELRYLCNMAWSQIAREMECDRKQVHRFHGRALNVLEFPK